MPVPKVVPTKIKAQYEQEEETMRMIDEGTFSFTKQARAEGIDRRYLSVKEQKEPLFRKELDKPEGKVIPQGPSVLVAPKKEKKFEKNPYEQLINGRL